MSFIMVVKDNQLVDTIIVLLPLKNASTTSTIVHFCNMLLVLLYFQQYPYFTHKVFLTLPNLPASTTFSEIHQKLVIEHSKQHQKQNYFYPKTLTTANDSKVNTTLNKHRPSQPNVLKNSE